MSDASTFTNSRDANPVITAGANDAGQNRVKCHVENLSRILANTLWMWAESNYKEQAEEACPCFPALACHHMSPPPRSSFRLLVNSLADILSFYRIHVIKYII